MEIIKLEEACVLCGVNKEVIIHFIEEDWIHPADEQTMKMDEEDLARIRLICELKDDFGVNEEGMSIILHLLDQLNLIYSEIDKFHQGEVL